MSELNPLPDNHDEHGRPLTGPYAKVPPLPNTDHLLTRQQIQNKAVDVSMADSLIRTIAINVNNTKLDDAAFREFIRNSIPLAFTSIHDRES